MAFVVGLGVVFGCSSASAPDGPGGDGASGGASTSSSGSSGAAAPQPATAAAVVTAVRIDIDYATGAAPHTETGLGGRSPFELAQTNLDRLFPGRTVTLPRTLETMHEVTGVAAGPYSGDAIQALATSHRAAAPNAATATLYVLFLDGYYADEKGENRGVLGVTLGNTGVIAMFKPVIEGAGSLLPTSSAAYVEQSTLVHEIGHAAGLVDNGLAMVKPHQDTEHGAHCTNTECIMYWSNEGVEGLSGFLGRNVGDGAKILYDADCLADIDAARVAP